MLSSAGYIKNIGLLQYEMTADPRRLVEQLLHVQSCHTWFHAFLHQI